MGTADSEVGRLRYLGCIVALRIQSNVYRAIRAPFEGDLLNRSPVRRPVLIGHRGVMGAPKLVPKLRKRTRERKI